MGEKFQKIKGVVINKSDVKDNYFNSYYNCN